MESTQTSFGESDAMAAYEKNPLAADVRYWGSWMLEKACEELAQFYPSDSDGSVPVAYLWSGPCPARTARRETSKKVVKLRTIKERGQKEEHLGLSTPARPAPLVDQLKRAADRGQVLA